MNGKELKKRITYICELQHKKVLSMTSLGKALEDMNSKLFPNEPQKYSVSRLCATLNHSKDVSSMFVYLMSKIYDIPINALFCDVAEIQNNLSCSNAIQTIGRVERDEIEHYKKEYERIKFQLDHITDLLMKQQH